jgi:hypothetical protein
MSSRLAQFDQPSWVTAAGTVVGYSLVLVVVFLSLFVLPYALWVLA